ncbi:hypothetical protein ScPMuIL_010855 [Solemya velum]
MPQIVELNYTTKNHIYRILTNYKECFLHNFITGRKLIAIDASALPKIGVYDFQDILALTRCIRDLLGIEKLSPTVALQNPMVAYIEIKRRTGRVNDNLTYNTFVRENEHWFS